MLIFSNHTATQEGIYSPPGYMGASLTQLSRIMIQVTTHHHAVNIFTLSNEHKSSGYVIIYKQKSSNELYETLSCNFIPLIAVKLCQCAGNCGHLADKYQGSLSDNPKRSCGLMQHNPTHISRGTVHGHWHDQQSDHLLLRLK